MKLKFTYNKEKDAWCLLNKGKSSNNSQNPTAVYQELVSKVGDSPTTEEVTTFVERYISSNNLNVQNYLESYGDRFNEISKDFTKIAEKVFGVILEKEVTAYLTINSRCPYNAQEGWFFISITKGSLELTIMHELWHFYTWERFGLDWEENLGKPKYNDIKEALTVLLNIECKHLLPENIEDKGYPQHQELREKIEEWWKERPDINYVWNKAVEYRPKKFDV